MNVSREQDDLLQYNLIQERKGLKPFDLPGGQVIWALNEKNARRKYKNLLKSEEKP